MGFLDERLAEARERLLEGVPSPHANSRIVGFDVVSVIAREVVAEKDAEIARLRSGLDTLGKTVGEGAEVVGRYFWSSPTAPEHPRKVTDAQIEALVGRVLMKLRALRDDVSLTRPDLIVAAEEWLETQSTDGPAVK
jgi:hypothetical protein